MHLGCTLSIFLRQKKLITESEFSLEKSRGSRKGNSVVPQWVTGVSMMLCTAAALIGLWLIVWKWDALKHIYFQFIQYLLDSFSVCPLQLKLELFAAGCCFGYRQQLWVQRVTQNVVWGIRLPFALRATWTSGHWGSKQHELLKALRAASEARGGLCAAQGFIFVTSRVCYSSVTQQAATSPLSSVPGCCRGSKNGDWIYLTQKIWFVYREMWEMGTALCTLHLNVLVCKGVN